MKILLIISYIFLSVVLITTIIRLIRDPLDRNDADNYDGGHFSNYD